MMISLRSLVPLVMAIPAPAMSVNLLAAPSNSVTAGDFATTLAPLISLDTGMPVNIIALFQRDYPAFGYANAAAAASGTITISGLAPLQSGLGGGLSISASFAPSPGSHAPHIYEWMQYLMIDPLSTPFQGADSSPFTDPPPDARDDMLPFYWTNLQRDTPGLGYLAGGNINDDLLFSDAPRVSDSRAPVKVRLSLYLVDFDSTSGAVTIYDGVQYGFDISTATTVPEPPTRGWFVAGICILALLKLRNRGFLPQVGNLLHSGNRSGS